MRAFTPETGSRGLEEVNESARVWNQGRTGSRSPASHDASINEIWLILPLDEGTWIAGRTKQHQPFI